MKPLDAARADDRDRDLAHRAAAADANWSLRIIMEARHRWPEQIMPSLALAWIELESGFRNIFGCDGGSIFCHQAVTRERVLKLVQHVKAGGTSNGVGPGQLTTLAFIEEANRDGGAWIPAVNIATSQRILGGLIRSYGVRGGLAAYNAGNPKSPDGLRYADRIIARRRHWQAVLA